MNELRADIIGKLKQEAPFQELVNVILQYKNRGVSQRVAYDVLEDIWREKGCDECTPGQQPHCGVLGHLMDWVWGFCSRADAIWTTPLSAKKVE